MESLRDLFVTLGLDADAASFASAQSMVDLLEKGLEKAVEAVKELADIFIESVVHTAKYGEEMEVLAQKTGISAEAIQQFSYAATLSHSSADDLQTGLAHLARELEKAKDGGEEAQKAFHKIGITMTDVRTKTPEQMFLLLADRMKATTSASVRQASAMDILGKGGVALIPTLMRGADGLKAMGEEADQLNTTMDEAGIHAAAQFKESLEKLHMVLEGVEHMIAGPLMDALQPVIDDFVEWLKVNRQVIQVKITEWVTRLASVVKLLVTFVKALPDAFNKFVATLRVVLYFVGAYIVAQQLMNVGLGQTLVNLALNTAAYLAYGAVLVWTAVKATVAWLAAAAPIILITAALALAALALQDFYVYLEGGDSLIGRIGPHWAKFVQEFFAPHPGDGWVVAYLRNMLDMIFNFERHWDNVVKKLTKAYDFLAYGPGGEEEHMKHKGAWETDPQDEQRARTRAAIVAADENARQGTRGVLAGGDSSSNPSNNYSGSAPWQNQGRFTPGNVMPASFAPGAGNQVLVQAPLTVVVPPGTPPALMKDVMKELIREHFTGVMSDAAAATGG